MNIPQGDRIDSLGAIAGLDFVLAEYGAEHVDKTALEGLPKYTSGCLISRVLIHYGYRAEFLRLLDETGHGARDLDWLTEGRITPLAARILGEAQRFQDAGETWGTAVAFAKKVLRDHARKYIQKAS